MYPMGWHRRWVSLVVYSLLLFLASCALIEKRIDMMVNQPAESNAADEPMRENPPHPKAEAITSSTNSKPLKLTVDEAILLCLENNRALRVQRAEPAIQQTFEEQESAVFDPKVGAEISMGRDKGERLARSGSETEDFTQDRAEGIISLEQYFPVGATVALEASTELDDSSLYDNRFYGSRLGMTVTQALLSGYGVDVNLAQLRQARIETRMSEYELRGFTQSLVAEVESAYWDYAVAGRQIEIVRESLKVVRQQLEETQELISVGRLAQSELAAVRAEVAAQEQALIEALANWESIHLQFLRLLNPAGPDPWRREIHLIHAPTLPEFQLEPVESHVEASKRMSPLLNQARLEIAKGDLELVKTRNGLLPLLELFVTLGKSGYADAFGDSVRHLDAGGYDAAAGVKFSYPLFNRDARARHQRAQLTKVQAQDALKNLSQLVEVDVRAAYIEVNRTKQQIAASKATRQFDQEKLRTETEKLRVGKSTSFLVAQAQRDLLVSRIAEVRALANYLKALIDLYRKEGSLLERHGIDAPGREPVRKH